MLATGHDGGLPFFAGGFRAALARGFAVNVFAACVYVGFEWLFFVTKPSLLEFEPFPGRLQVLASAPLPLIVVNLAAGLPPLVLARFSLRRWQVRGLLSLALLLPGFLAAGTGLLLVENFTYTLFGFTVVSKINAWRVLYGLLFLAVWGRAVWLFAKWVSQGRASQAGRMALPAAAVLAAVSLGAATLGKSEGETDAVRVSPSLSVYPDIFLIGIDGIEANHVSGHGYHRPTTPKLDRWMEDALVFENAFSNAGTTTGAVTSLLTGRLPTRTRVIYRPDVLRGASAHQHLAGILRGANYRSISLGVRHHADPFDLNMVDGFDRAIGGRTDTFRAMFGARRLGALVGEISALFLQESGERVLTRAGHVLGIIRGANWFEDLRDARGRKSYTDETRINELLEFAKTTRSPIFAHLHLMDAHGARLKTRNQQFSGTVEKQSGWNDDDYDNAIRDFDDRLEEFVAWLKAERRYERAIVIVYSDHGRGWNVRERVPLIFRFPGNSPKGRRQENVQLADVAPTVLSFLELPVPSWMDGTSLLAAPPSDPRPLYFAIPRKSTAVRGGSVVLDLKPPFFTLGAVGVTHCDFMHVLNVDTGEVSEHRINGHTRPCPRSPVESSAAREALLTLLMDSGYEVSGIPAGKF